MAGVDFVSEFREAWLRSSHNLNFVLISLLTGLVRVEKGMGVS